MQTQAAEASDMDEGEVGRMASPPPTLSGRIERLFEVSRPPHAPARMWRNSEVVAACRAAGLDLSESHLSELRRGIKSNPTRKTLDALAWFFEVRVGWFLDDELAMEIEQHLIERAERLERLIAEAKEAQEQEREAALELQRALRYSGVTRVAHRGAGGNARERANMMRALARALLDDDEDDPGSAGQQ
ncbi:hypothetical protein [Pseudonocardia parietis]|uniref:Transcriptional regulator with XRE-family HTH domain n=1 Tax=Pseudonocardia parietis TaxID=570936 RepID=A0ABS4W717_9PSEU|nr:hypothetical protein [Pseudonocardia parietis]MBP2371965.1 transcriptional regulator with XRE-family HTH domain [Pseudonocardia parietis]